MISQNKIPTPALELENFVNMVQSTPIFNASRFQIRLCYEFLVESIWKIAFFYNHKKVSLLFLSLDINPVHLGSKLPCCHLALTSVLYSKNRVSDLPRDFILYRYVCAANLDLSVSLLLFRSF